MSEKRDFRKEWKERYDGKGVVFKIVSFNGHESADVKNEWVEELLDAYDSRGEELKRIRTQRYNLANLIENLWVDKNMEMRGD